MSSSDPMIDRKQESPVSDSERLCPYPGSVPFSEDQQQYFFGRNDESNDLVSLLYSNSVVLLYSQSGAGKSSLLNAGLLPLLKKDEATVLGPVRFGSMLHRTHREESWDSILLDDIALKQRNPDKINANDYKTIEAYLKRLLEINAHDESPKMFLLLIDQFEEFLTNYNHLAEHRVEFVRSLKSVMSADPRLRVLIAAREEYLAQLDPCLKLLGVRPGSRFRLKRLSAAKAKAAIVEPALLQGIKYSANAASLLIKELSEEPIFGGIDEAVIEPMHLQLACQELWNSLSDSSNTISEESVRGQLLISLALSNHCNRKLQQISVLSGMEETKLRTWIAETLITPINTRGSALLVNDHVAGMPRDTLTVLCKAGLLREESRAGGSWFELSHDRFIGAILASNSSFFAGLETGLRLPPSKIEVRAREWKAATALSNLLTRAELAVFNEELPIRRERGLFVGSLVSEYVSASATAEVKRRQSKARNFQVMLGVSACIAACALTISYLNAEKAGMKQVKADVKEQGHTLEETAKKIGVAQWQSPNATRRYLLAQSGTLYEKAGAIKEYQAVVDKIRSEVWIALPAATIGATDIIRAGFCGGSLRKSVWCLQANGEIRMFRWKADEKISSEEIPKISESWEHHSKSTIETEGVRPGNAWMSPYGEFLVRREYKHSGPSAKVVAWRIDQSSTDSKVRASRVSLKNTSETFEEFSDIAFANEVESAGGKHDRFAFMLHMDGKRVCLVQISDSDARDSWSVICVLKLKKPLVYLNTGFVNEAAGVIVVSGMSKSGIGMQEFRFSGNFARFASGALDNPNVVKCNDRSWEGVEHIGERLSPDGTVWNYALMNVEKKIAEGAVHGLQLVEWNDQGQVRIGKELFAGVSDDGSALQRLDSDAGFRLTQVSMEDPQGKGVKNSARLSSGLGFKDLRFIGSELAVFERDGKEGVFVVDFQGGGKSARVIELEMGHGASERVALGGDGRDLLLYDRDEISVFSAESYCVDANMSGAKLLKRISEEFEKQLQKAEERQRVKAEDKQRGGPLNAHTRRQPGKFERRALLGVGSPNPETAE